MTKLIVVDKENLKKVYKYGIKKTGFKSKSLQKINDLRKELDLPERNKELNPKSYDTKVTEKLKEMDFSPLDNKICGISSHYHNSSAWIFVQGFEFFHLYTPSFILDCFGGRYIPDALETIGNTVEYQN